MDINVDTGLVFHLYMFAFAWAIAINFRPAYAFIPLIIGFVILLVA